MPITDGGEIQKIRKKNQLESLKEIKGRRKTNQPQQ